MASPLGFALPRRARMTFLSEAKTGKELDGRNTFASKRPGWEVPIHELLAKRGSRFVFHGNDHICMHGERDGVVYQLVPQPVHSRNDNNRNADEYGYKSGVKFGASGIRRVNVSAESRGRLRSRLPGLRGKCGIRNRCGDLLVRSGSAMMPGFTSDNIDYQHRHGWHANHHQRHRCTV